MNNDYSNPDCWEPHMWRKIEEYASEADRAPGDVAAEMAQRIKDVPRVFDTDPKKNFLELVDLMKSIPWDDIRELRPSLIAKSPVLRADWTDTDVFLHLLAIGSEEILKTANAANEIS